MSTLNQPLDQQSASKPINRREFLYYLGGGSMALFTATMCGAVYQYTARNLPLELEAGVFEVDMDLLPAQKLLGVHRAAAAYLIPTSSGLLALNRWCPYGEGIKVVWVDVSNRYECPFCGSKYEFDGTYITGPALRSLDQYVLHVRVPGGTRRTPPEGGPISLENATQIFVDTNRVILGEPRPR